MPQEILNGREISIGIQHLRGRRMAKMMTGEVHFELEFTKQRQE
jgi:hypothetical protein